MLVESQTRTIGAGFGYLAAFLNVVAFVWYVVVIFGHDVTTNPITWWLWLGETITGLLIYADRTKDRSKWLLEATALVGVVIVGGYLAVEAVLGKVDVVLASVETIDYWITGLTIATFCFWLGTRKRLGASAALWLFQVVLLLAAVPLIRATWETPSAEPLGPWAIWTLAFVSLTICTRLRWDGKDVFIYAASNMATHGIITAIVLVGVVSQV